MKRYLELGLGCKKGLAIAVLRCCSIGAEGGALSLSFHSVLPTPPPHGPECQGHVFRVLPSGNGIAGSGGPRGRRPTGIPGVVRPHAGVWGHYPLAFQDLLLHSRQDARQSVCLHRAEPAQRESRVPCLPLHQTENGQWGEAGPRQALALPWQPCPRGPCLVARAGPKVGIT